MRCGREQSGARILGARILRAGEHCETEHDPQDCCIQSCSRHSDRHGLLVDV